MLLDVLFKFSWEGRGGGRLARFWGGGGWGWDGCGMGGGLGFEVELLCY
jgi:hypothetical protein